MRASGSLKAVRASSNDTRCFSWLMAAFRRSHSNLRSIPPPHPYHRTSLRSQCVGPRHGPHTSDRLSWYLLDLFAKYRWRNVELGIQLLNLTNTDWPEAQFEDNSCVRSQEQSRDPARPCFSKPGKNPVTPPGAIHYTPDNPIGVRAGVTFFF
jgi:hypothetical protein